MKTLKTIDIMEILEYDMSHITNNVSEKEYAYYMNSTIGEHYRLLAYLSLKFENETFLDLGTHLGYSAICLANNRSNKVITYDIVDNRIKNDLESYSNIEFRMQNIFDIDDKTILNSSIILLDITHSGIDEKNFLKKLSDIGYSGIVILDDIYYSEAMKEFWNSIADKKIDLTEYFHATGTGILSNSNIKFIINDKEISEE